MTKAEGVDKFCLYFDYDTTALEGETKQDFFQRKKQEWAKQVIFDQIRKEKNAEADALKDGITV